jgi:hypothetical protein
MTSGSEGSCQVETSSSPQPRRDREEHGRSGGLVVHHDVARDAGRVPRRVLGLEGDHVGAVPESGPGAEVGREHGERGPTDEVERRGRRSRPHREAVLGEVLRAPRGPQDVHAPGDARSLSRDLDVGEGRRQVHRHPRRARRAHVPGVVLGHHVVGVGAVRAVGVQVRRRRFELAQHVLPAEDAVAGEVGLVLGPDEDVCGRPPVRITFPVGGARAASCPP